MWQGIYGFLRAPHVVSEALVKGCVGKAEWVITGSDSVVTDSVVHPPFLADAWLSPVLPVGSPTFACCPQLGRTGWSSR